MKKIKKNKIIPKLRFPEFKNNGEWEEKMLGQICKFTRGPFGGSLKKEIFVENGFAVYEQSHAIYEKFDYFRYYITEEKFNEMKRFAVIPNDILMSCSGTMGKFAIVPTESKQGIINQALLKLSFKEDFYIRFIKETLELPLNQEKLLSQSAGGAIKNVVSVDKIKEISIYIPCFNEQQKIADCLSSLDDLIESQMQKLENLKTHKKGLLQQLFPAEGEKVPKIRFPEFKKKGDWEEKKLGQISEIVRGGSPRPIELFITNSSEGLNWLKIGDVAPDSKYITQTKVKVIKDSLSKTREVVPGDLILSNSMSFGRPYILKIKSCIHDGWIAITKINECINRDYIYYYILSTSSQSYFLNNSAGSGVQNLSVDIIKMLLVIFPALPEQQKIASCLSSLDELITAQSEKVELLKQHKKGLLQQLFPKMN